jgi:hypothetical protein
MQGASHILCSRFNIHAFNFCIQQILKMADAPIWLSQYFIQCHYQSFQSNRQTRNWMSVLCIHQEYIYSFLAALRKKLNICSIGVLWYSKLYYSSITHMRKMQGGSSKMMGLFFKKEKNLYCIHIWMFVFWYAIQKRKMYKNSTPSNWFWIGVKFCQNYWNAYPFTNVNTFGNFEKGILKTQCKNKELFIFLWTQSNL